MNDDREEFEREQVSRDGEGEDFEQGVPDIVYRVKGEEWISRGAQSRRFDEAMARLGAEVAAHEQEEVAPPCESCGKPSDGYSLDDVPLCAECAGALAEVATQEPVRLPLTLGNLQGVVRSPITPAEAASLGGSGPRFGDRLREWRAGDSDTRRLLAIADAIDQDAAEQRLWAGQGEQRRRAVREADLRERVEELVEELRYTAIVCGPSVISGMLGPETGRKDYLDVEPFLERLAGIFGERKEGPPKSKPAEGSRWFEIPGREGAKGLRVAVQLDGVTFLWPLDPDVHPGFALSGEAARDLEIILRAFLPGDVALAAEAIAVLEALPPEDDWA